MVSSPKYFTLVLELEQTIGTYLEKKKEKTQKKQI